MPLPGNKKKVRCYPEGKKEKIIYGYRNVMHNLKIIWHAQNKDKLAHTNTEQVCWNRQQDPKEWTGLASPVRSYKSHFWVTCISGQRPALKGSPYVWVKLPSCFSLQDNGPCFPKIQSYCDKKIWLITTIKPNKQSIFPFYVTNCHYCIKTVSIMSIAMLSSCFSNTCLCTA